MKLHDLKPTPGTKPKKIRRGRGDSGKQGSFSGRGVKGQNARTGGGVRLGFEGGQTPLFRRMPKKRGFTPINRVHYTAVSLASLNRVFTDGETVSPQTLIEKRLLHANETPKIVGGGKLDKKLTFENVAMTKSVATLIG